MCNCVNSLFFFPFFKIFFFNESLSERRDFMSTSILTRCHLHPILQPVLVRFQLVVYREPKIRSNPRSWPLPSPTLLSHLGAVVEWEMAGGRGTLSPPDEVRGARGEAQCDAGAVRPRASRAMASAAVAAPAASAGCAACARWAACVGSNVVSGAKAGHSAESRRRRQSG